MWTNNGSCLLVPVEKTNYEARVSAQQNVKAQEMLAVPGQGWPLTLESEISSPEEQIALACGCNRCLLDTLSDLYCLEPRIELIIDAQDLPRDLCTVSDSVSYWLYIGHPLTE